MDNLTHNSIPPKPIVVGITGASGSILGFRLVEALLKLGQTVELVITEKSYQVILEEMELKLGGGKDDEKSRAILTYLQLPIESYLEQLKVYGNHRLDAPPSSGSHLTQGMVIIPCSMATLGRVASGISDNLVARSADVTMKEARKLVVVPRESPFNAIHLQNMTRLSQCGVVILPPMLSFYLSDFHTLDGQINYTVAKVLDQFQIDHRLLKRWGS